LLARFRRTFDFAVALADPLTDFLAAAPVAD
jgi:hypothetical protein